MGRFGGEGKSGESVHDKVNPKHLSGGKGRLAEKAGASEYNEHSDDVDGQLELEELADVVIDVATESNSSQNGAEIVIHQLDIASVLGDISTSDSHSKADIGSVESGSIVGAITSHSNSLVELDETVDKHELVIGLRAGHNLEMLVNLSEDVHVLNSADNVVDLFKLYFVIFTFDFNSFALNFDFAANGFAECSTFHAFVLLVLSIGQVGFGKNTSFYGNSSGSVNVVASDHTHVDTCAVALLDSGSDSISEGVLESEDTNHGEVVLKNLHIFGGLEIVSLGSHSVKLVHWVVNVRDKKGSETLGSVRFHNGINAVVFLIIIKFVDLTLVVKKLSAALDDHFGGTLAENTDSLAIVDKVSGSGPLASGAERNRNDGLLSFSLGDLSFGISAGFDKIVNETDFGDITSGDISLTSDISIAVSLWLNEGRAVHDHSLDNCGSRLELHNIRVHFAIKDFILKVG